MAEAGRGQVGAREGQQKARDIAYLHKFMLLKWPLCLTTSPLCVIYRSWACLRHVHVLLGAEGERRTGPRAPAESHTGRQAQARRLRRCRLRFQAVRDVVRTLSWACEPRVGFSKKAAWRRVLRLSRGGYARIAQSVVADLG